MELMTDRIMMDFIIVSNGSLSFMTFILVPSLVHYGYCCHGFNGFIMDAVVGSMDFIMGAVVGSIVSLWVLLWVQRTPFGFYDFIWHEFMIITITLSGKIRNNK